MINVAAGIDGPTKQQLRLYKQIVNRRRSIRSAIESALFRHYKEKIVAYGEYYITTPDGAELAPDLHHSEEIWGMLYTPFVKILPMKDDDVSVRFALDFSVAWDEEHCPSLFIQDWKVVRVGDAGERFF